MYNVPTAEPKDPGWRFVGLWILTYIVGSGFGVLILFPGFAAITVPVAQWFVLRRFVKDAGWWIPSGMIEIVLGLGAVSLVNRLDPELSPFVIYGLRAIAYGLPLGGAQFLVLYRSIPQPGWWILLQILLFLVGILLSAIIAAQLVVTILFASLYIGLSGVGLRLLLAATPQAHRQLRWLLVGLAVACGTTAIFS